jgi:eukaryotic-like serine/threonine-protein kinase
MALEADQVLNNRYRIIKLLGRGGFGEVYQAWDIRLEGHCAVKRNLQTEPEVRRQFEQEARMLFKLRHPNLPKVNDYFLSHEEEQYLVMEFIEGEDLRSRMKRSGTPPVEQALAWLEQVCDALSYMHARQPPVIHRDIKPANIIITPEGQAMLVDFGIAKADPQMRTVSGARGWSPGFTPPEQYGQGRTDAQSDVYSLGATAYALLTGESPPDAMDIAAGDKSPARPVHEINPLVPPHVSRAIEQAMQLSRAQRTRSAVEFQRALSAQSEPEPAPNSSSEDDITIIELPRSPETDNSEPQSAAQQPSEAGISETEIEALSHSPEAGSSETSPEALPQTPEPGIPEPGSDALPGRKKISLKWIAGAIGIVLVVIALGGLAWWIAQGNKGRGQQTGENVQEPGLPTSTAQSLLKATSIPPTNLSIAPSCTAIGQTWTSPKDGMILVCVPEGDFSMGSEEGNDDEKPAHTVYMDAFWIDRTEVTNAMFAQFVSATNHQTLPEKVGSSWAWTGSEFQEVSGTDWRHPNGPQTTINGLEDHPVVQVSWEDARAYCQWAQRKLPSEAQWEKAARGTDGRTYPWGNASGPVNFVNFADTNSNADWADKNVDDGYETTAPIGSYMSGASPYGALDMAGNVWEWVNDWYQENYYSNSPEQNPGGPATGSEKLLRGGSWNNRWPELLSYSRWKSGADGRISSYGFRCSAPAP